MTGTNGKHPFTEAMGQLTAVLGGKPDDWLIQSDERDPFRLVRSEANLRDATWTRETWDKRGIVIPSHDRGYHYSVIGEPMPTGIKRHPAHLAADRAKAERLGLDPNLTRYDVYDNTAWHAEWSEKALKYAPWIGTIPFGWMRDNRNRDGIKRIVTPQDAPEAWIEQQGADAQVYDLRGIALPNADELRPVAGIERFTGRADDATPEFNGSPYCPQRFQIAILGEKTSLEPIMEPLAKGCDAHLFLASGDLTNPMIYDIARVGGELDTRPMHILYVSDSDPSGNHMPVVLAWKLIALKMLWFPELDFQIHRVGLLPSQVKAYKVRAEEDPDWHPLTESPLKEGESRADAWFAETGTFQTEIDSLITFHPEELKRMTVEMIGHFYDPTLPQRVIDTDRAWTQRQLARADALDDKSAEREAAAAEMALLQREIQERADRIEELADSVRIDLSALELDDPPEFPEADLDYDNMPEPLVDSEWKFVDQVKALQEAKKYRR